ncbi:hypothetical protein AHMF7605_26690 [Adhaeribacter arboris]|uniref:Type IX secretion system membrane protein PorP/SprF n=1 Tax=Adhaeribacter arboris TaxID=2072846 RepID=A0A2T2YMW9_9BACT|nr:hypothetical protein [Adhaeribacter arboris]PSR56829.1 hypothetical protein AHMF7605_26690 [Adhaeribacter arboris]
MIKKFYPSCLGALLVTVFIPFTSQAQIFKPIFEDGEGRTSILAPLGYFGVNTENSSIRFQYFYSRSASQENFTAPLKRNRFFWGISVAGSAAGGLSNLFSYGSFTPGTSASLFAGQRSLLFPAIGKTGEPVLHGVRQIAIEDWLTLRVGGQVANYTLFDASRVFDEQLFQEKFRDYSTQLAYTVLIGGATSLGASWDVGRVNNIDELTPIKFKQQTIITDPRTGQTTRIFEEEVDAFSGSYLTKMVHTYSLDAVHYITPASEINFALHGYGRLKRMNKYSVYKAGLGFYLFPKSKVAGGLFIESSDLTNKISATKDFAKRIDVGLTVKYVLPSLGIPNP